MSTPRLAGTLWALAVVLLVAVSVTRSDGAGARDVRVAGATRTVVAPDGSEVVVPRRPERVFPGHAAAVDWAALLVPPSRLVAVPLQADTWSVVAREPGRWSDLPRVPRFTSEALLGLAPDLVLSAPWQDRAVVARVTDAGVPVVDVPVAATWSGVLDAGRFVASVLGEEDAARAAIASLEARRARLASRPDAPTLSLLPYVNFGGGGSTSGTGTTVDVSIRLAGFTNAAAAAGIEGHADLPIERILALDFDAFLVGGTDGASASAEWLRGHPAASELAQVESGAFVVLPEALHASASFTLLDAAEEIARQGDELGR